MAIDDCNDAPGDKALTKKIGPKKAGPRQAGAFTYRAAEPGDGPQIAALEGAAFDPRLETLWGREGAAELLTAKPGKPATGFGLIGFSGDVPAAFVLWRQAADEGEILKIAAAPQWRRRGFCEILLRAVLEQGRAKGVGVFFLEMRKTNASACALYNKIGFVEAGVRRDYYGAGQDAVQMRLNLC